MKKRLIFPCGIFAAGLLISAACGTSPLKQLKGKWRAAGDLDQYHAWYLEYTFSGNTYEMQGYPPIYEKGSIKLKETKGDSLLINFHVEKSDPQYEDHDEWIYMKGNQFSMGTRVFRKLPDEEKQN